MSSFYLWLYRFESLSFPRISKCNKKDYSYDVKTVLILKACLLFRTEKHISIFYVAATTAIEVDPSLVGENSIIYVVLTYDEENDELVFSSNVNGSFPPLALNDGK